MLVQEKLLRVIEYGELERVGGSQPLQVNVRLVCASQSAGNGREINSAPTWTLAFDVVTFHRCANDAATSAGRTVCDSDVPRTRPAALSRLC
jgi:hypothetical protein